MSTVSNADLMRAMSLGVTGSDNTTRVRPREPGMTADGCARTKDALACLHRFLRDRHIHIAKAARPAAQVSALEPLKRRDLLPPLFQLVRGRLLCPLLQSGLPIALGQRGGAAFALGLAAASTAGGVGSAPVSASAGAHCGRRLRREAICG